MAADAAAPSGSMTKPSDGAGEGGSVELEGFVSSTLRLLEQEHAAELEEAAAWRDTLPGPALEKKGVLVRKLRVVERRSGLGGRTLLVLESSVPVAKGETRALPANELSSGDVVQLRSAASATAVDDQPPLTDGSLLSGLVYRATATRIIVAIDADAAEEDITEPLALLKLVDETTHKRLRLGLNALRTGTLPLAAAQTGGSFVDAPGAAPGAIRDVAFGIATPRALKVPPRVGDAARLTDEEISAEKERMKTEAGLNAGQEEAIDFAMRCSALACIHGPPGTGKSTTVVELIRRLVVLGGAKVLACAPSNVATDNLVERLAATSYDRRKATKGRGKAKAQRQLRLVRVGHPARLLPSVLSHSLDVVIQSGDEKALANDVRRELDTLLSRPVPGGRAQRRADINALRKELTQREEAATAEAIRSADVVLCTCVGAVSWALRSVPEFDVVVVDEAAQTLEAACWLPLLRGRRAVLAGDHLQLPPVVKSSSAAEEGFGQTLFDRLAAMHGDAVLRMLTTQYRMNADISKWASDQMYGGRLIAGDGIGDRVLCDLPGVTEADLTKAALMLIDTAGCSDCEETTDEGGSKLNNGEAELVSAYLDELFTYCSSESSSFGVGDIGVIAPYNAQVACLRERLADHCQAGLEISTVDGFQGREKEVIILSMTRSNSQGDIGFLREDRRTNVAVTRARRQCVVIADSETVGAHPFLRTLLDHCSDVGMHRSAAEYGLQGGPGMRPSSKRPTSNRHAQTAIPGDHRRKPEHLAGRARDDESSQRTQQLQPTPKLDMDETRARFKPILQSCFDPIGTGQVKFPPTLNGFERSVIHALAEELGLDHESFGDGADRHICCSKPSTDGDSRQNGNQSTNLEPAPEPNPSPVLALHPEPELEPEAEPELDVKIEVEPEPLFQWIVKGKQQLQIHAPANFERIQDEIFTATGIKPQDQKLVAKGRRIDNTAACHAALGKSGTGKLLLISMAADKSTSKASQEKTVSTEPINQQFATTTTKQQQSQAKPTHEQTEPTVSQTAAPRSPPSGPTKHKEAPEHVELSPALATTSTESNVSRVRTPTPAEKPPEGDVHHETLSAAEKKRRKRQRQKEAKQAAAAAAAAEAAAAAAKDDVDAVLASLGLPTKPGFCAYGASEGKQCSTKVGVIGQVCDHCKLKFCLLHAHAQKHGCGAAQQAQGRQAFVERQAASGGSRTTARGTETDRAGLRKSLSSKVEESARSRQRKQKPKGKKKR